uniref:F-box domain-containing protein n=2 Tax=Cryptomonas curvata TaxID=233186 RepID=A0A7S0QNW2_9CRYP|mmetsp:Transcript_53838/g.112430  ORF Transcript_53838/g.112430 Transcript_53838/m.112430 type:complete len:105 (+) Transcript_53838:375-689(+)
MFGNSDAVHRLLCEFSKIQDVSALRKTNRQLKTFIDDHPQLWRQIEFSPPGLCRVARLESATSMERFLRKGAEDGNVEAQMMLALLYHHGYRCPCHPLAIPGCF